MNTTEREAQLQQAINEKKWTARVVNVDGKTQLTTLFNSNINDIDAILHKIKLDLMTSLAMGKEFIIISSIREDDHL